MIERPAKCDNRCGLRLDAHQRVAREFLEGVRDSQTRKWLIAQDDFSFAQKADLSGGVIDRQEQLFMVDVH
jgi:hypothetical protein